MTNNRLLDKASIVRMLIFTVSYFVLSYLLIGFKTEQVFLMSLVNVLYFLSLKSRRFIKGFSIFIVYWIIFDYMKAFPNYRFNTVHIKDLYTAEKTIFGIYCQGKTMTPNEYLLSHATTVLNVVTGFFYLTWIPVPLGFAAYLFYKNKRQFFYFSLTFLLVNLLGFAIYYSFPAAPPWYVQDFGFIFDPHTMGNVAGLGRFDAYFNTTIFKSLYAKSSNVFAAMPSLHSSYPLIVFYYGLKNKLGLINILFGIIMAGIWFSAVYNSQHYILDVLCGIICGMLGILLFNRVVLSNNFISSVIEKGVADIS
jgi:hypothetical protein